MYGFFEKERRYSTPFVRKKFFIQGKRGNDTILHEIGTNVRRQFFYATYFM